MKHISLISLAAATLISFNSCENAEFLNRVPYSSTSPENFYSNESQMKMALTSCYEIINAHKIPGLTYCQRGTYGQGLLYLMNGPSDDVVGTASSMGEGVEMEQCTFDEGSLCIRQFWKVFYTGINRCNIILRYIDDIDSISDEMKTRFIGEARFMRAFLYYHLAWNFGGVPMVTDYASSGEEPRSSLQDIYTKIIIPDLQYAIDHLEEASGIIQNISATKYTAEAYLGRICNYLATCKRYKTGDAFVAEQPLNDFSWVDETAMTKMAKDALEDVVLNSPYILNDDYRVNFLECSKTAQYRECLFLSEFPTSGSEGYWPNSFYLPTPTSSGTDYPVTYGGRHIPTYRGFYMYHPEDMRRDWNYTGRISDGFVEVQIENYPYGIPTKRDSIDVRIKDAEGNDIKLPDGTFLKERILHPLYNSPTQTYRPNSNLQICTGKFRHTRHDLMQHTYQQSALSYPLMRLADVYLMYAEALYFGGDEANARIWMNKVLRRAATSDDNYNTLVAYYHRDDFVDELLESRERELFMECSRKYDLIRFNRIDAAIASLDPTTIADYKGADIDDTFKKIDEGNNIRTLIETVQTNWMPHKIWLPISEEQIAVNHALKQNAGWSKDNI